LKKLKFAGFKNKYLHHMKVLGIGNALVDILVSLPDDRFLQEHHLPRGSMQLVDKELSDSILKSASGFYMNIASGGSAANTINGLAKLGIETGFIGSLGIDEHGRHFISDFEKNNVFPHISYSQTHSGKAIALVSPDGERTFATNLGAAIELGASDITDDIVSGYDIVHIEGYLLQNYELIEAAVETARKNNALISLDLASFNVVEQHLDFLKQLIPGNIDILFANEEEAFALTGAHHINALEVMAEMAPLSIYKNGSEGSLISDRKQIHHVKALPSPCKDTTGAGDLYAAGFLYGYIRKKSLKECGWFGSVVAGHVIRIIGAKIPESTWNEIYQELQIQK
jgi:sugar/nucleoside kinase (ribokinase family)